MEPLAAALLGLKRVRSSPASWQSDGHRAAVTCLLEHTCQVFDQDRGTLQISLLLSGAADGSLRAHSLADGSSYLSLHLHTAEVSPTPLTPSFVCTLTCILFGQVIG